MNKPILMLPLIVSVSLECCTEVMSPSPALLPQEAVQAMHWKQKTCAASMLPLRALPCLDPCAGPIPGVQQCLSVLSLIHQPGGLTGYHFPFIKTLPPLIFPLENQTVSSMIDFLCYRTIYCLYCPSERSVLGFLAIFINCWYKASAGTKRNRKVSGSTSGRENWNGLQRSSTSPRTSSQQ